MRLFIETIFSLIRILRNSKLNTKKKFPSTNDSQTLRILGNGKSLNEDSFINKNNIDYLVVNRHVLSENYIQLKPKCYVLADPHFFNHPEGLNILREINKKTTWPIFLYIVYNSTNKNAIDKIITNKNIKIVPYNITPFIGLKSIKYLMYKLQLSMPVVQNVLVAAIMIGIITNYKRIELYGVEHTWTKYLFVNQNNIVYLENPHFYDKEKVEAKPLTEIQHTQEYPFFLILKNYSRMFESYWEIKQFISDCNIDVNIINKTKESFIDAFKKE